MLRSELQKKSEEIVKYKGADLILEENERLKESNQKYQADTKKSQEEMEAVKNEYFYKKSALSSEERILEKKASDLKDKENNLTKEVRKLVNQEADRLEYKYRSQYDSCGKQIKEKYRKKKEMILFVMLISLLYSIGTTIFTAIMNEVFYKDIVQFFLALLNEWDSYFAKNGRSLVGWQKYQIRLKQ